MELTNDIEDIKVSNLLVSEINTKNALDITSMINELVSYYNSTKYKNDIAKYITTNKKTEKQIWKAKYRELTKKYKIHPPVVTLNYYYFKMLQQGDIKERCQQFEINNKGKQTRTTSGITQITVVSSPYPNGQEFSCEYNCYYCPNEPAHEGNNWQAQPRSYLYNEPAVRRANTYGFDAAKQMWARMSTLLLCGLPIDKLEVMVLGGTWSSYPEGYREEFVRDLYYAANTFYIDINAKPPRLTLEEEMHLNQRALVRIIGLTLETRPDCITARELLLLRSYNCTRVQIGVQHTDNRILARVNRASYLSDTKRAIANLLNVGLKVDIHIMFDLPYATKEDDIAMIDLLLATPELRFDQVKFYPFSSLDWTKTKEWEDAGKDLHYTPQELMEVILYTKRQIPEWVRINRVIRDIPSDYITAGNDVPNLRQEIHKEMDSQGWSCRCIRCREPKNNPAALLALETADIVIREYDASNGREYFISYESEDKKWIYGFCRLRLSDSSGYIEDLPPTIYRSRNDKPEEINLFPQLNNSALIRELHVYGMMNPVAANSQRVQHRGIGQALVKKAEEIAICQGYSKMNIIAGVGVREYYERKLGYTLNGTYMEKKLKIISNKLLLFILIILIMCCFSIINVYN